MDGMEAVLDAAPEAEIAEGAEEIEQGLDDELAEGEVEPEGSAEGDAAKSDDPYTTRFSREMRAALKQWEQAHPEAAKFAKQARDNHARQFALQQLEPKGIDGVRERYALLDAIGGPDGIAGLQERIAGVDELDSLLAAGNPKAFDVLPEEVSAGLAKLAPAYLERVAKTDPQAFETAITPHVVNTLANSDVVREFNNLIDVLNTNDDPRLDEKTKFQYAMRSLAKMGNAFNALVEKAGQIQTAPGVDDERAKFEQERTKFEQEKQNIHWQTHITPHAAKAENDKFSELLKPYDARLKLSDPQKQAALRDFKGKIAATCKADADYQRQLKIYRNQKNPDPAAVRNWINVELNKKAAAAFNEVKDERWSSFLAGKPKPQPGAARQAAARPAVEQGVEIRTVKPAESEIDFKNTPIADLRQKKYRLFNGKTVQVVPAQ